MKKQLKITDFNVKQLPAVKTVLSLHLNHQIYVVITWSFFNSLEGLPTLYWTFVGCRHSARQVKPNHVSCFAVDARSDSSLCLLILQSLEVCYGSLVHWKTNNGPIKCKPDGMECHCRVLWPDANSFTLSFTYHHNCFSMVQCVTFFYHMGKKWWQGTKTNKKKLYSEFLNTN